MRKKDGEIGKMKDEQKKTNAEATGLQEENDEYAYEDHDRITPAKLKFESGRIAGATAGAAARTPTRADRRHERLGLCHSLPLAGGHRPHHAD